jgi:hypothetical protein
MGKPSLFVFDQRRTRGHALAGTAPDLAPMTLVKMATVNAARALGATVAASPRAAAEGADFVVSIVAEGDRGAAQELAPRQFSQITKSVSRFSFHG